MGTSRMVRKRRGRTLVSDQVFMILPKRQDEAAIKICELMAARRLLPKNAWSLCRIMHITIKPMVELQITPDNTVMARNAFNNKHIVKVVLLECLEQPLHFLGPAKLEMLWIKQEKPISVGDITIPLHKISTEALVMKSRHIMVHTDDAPWLAHVLSQVKSITTLQWYQCCSRSPQFPSTLKELTLEHVVIYNNLDLSSCWGLESVRLEVVTVYGGPPPDFSSLSHLLTLFVVDFGCGVANAVQSFFNSFPDCVQHLEVGWSEDVPVEVHIDNIPASLTTLCIWNFRAWPFAQLPDSLAEVKFMSRDAPSMGAGALPRCLPTLIINTNLKWPLASLPAG
eukprot:TRINITY_DN31129_c0_g1_i1.p1 TRINITY_DN31129_c0_g1~~TRINITY_DN31129_c0_g1_i1.p1  ORF type:complete len:359 (+),score=33.00 TRINITY_DN31129_c0_g1_i1:61-1077(+)